MKLLAVRPSRLSGPWAGLLAAGCLLSLDCAVVRATPIQLDTSPYWDGISSVSSFGKPAVATFGQTLVAPAGATTLDSFTFDIKGHPSAQIQMKAVVFNWTGSLQGHGGHAFGSPLYVGPSVSYSGNDTYQLVTATIPGGLAVTPGGQYVIAFTVSDLVDWNATVDNSVTEWALVPRAHVPPVPASASGGGGMVWFNNHEHFGDLNGGLPWTTTIDFGDLSFKATFNAPAAVPDAGGSACLLGLGLAGLGLLRRRAGIV